MSVDSAEATAPEHTDRRSSEKGRMVSQCDGLVQLSSRWHSLSFSPHSCASNRTRCVFPLAFTSSQS